VYFVVVNERFFFWSTLIVIVNMSRADFRNEQKILLEIFVVVKFQTIVSIP
jgi:hypothetical protein